MLYYNPFKANSLWIFSFRFQNFYYPKYFACQYLHISEFYQDFLILKNQWLQICLVTKFYIEVHYYANLKVSLQAPIISLNLIFFIIVMTYDPANIMW